MSTTNSTLRESIGRTLAQPAGATPDACAVAEAAIRTWRQVAARLAPVIGARGVNVLFSRSLQMTNSTFPWLSMDGELHDGSDPMTNLRTCIETRDPTIAAEASAALLVTFTELLATLIGTSLTERLLGPVWTPLAPTSEQETTP